MPNLVPPVVTADQALAYRGRIEAAMPEGARFTPLMTLYLTEQTDPKDVARAHAEGIATAVKLYPAGATTNSASGVRDFDKVRGVLEIMAEIGMPLCVHGEVTDPSIDIFDREAVFIDTVLDPLRRRNPDLRVVMEHITTAQGVDYARAGGANLAAIGDGSAQNWELFQFASATLVGPKTYDISLRLRGQLGSDALMPAVWPVGSTFVLLDAALQQIDLPLSARGLARSYRFVAADRGYDDLSAVGLTQAFDGIGLRPYAVVHLRAAKTADALGLSWVRRSRIDGDSWQSVEVPLGEDNEAYLLRVIQAGVVKREMTLSTPAFLYTAQMQASDGVAGAVSISVAQLSNLYGAGPARSLSLML